MCGIAGILELFPGVSPDLERLQRMADTLVHRGPDEQGFYRSGSVGLAHRRLSIIDLASGQQPLQSADGQVCLVFNGEIYNYRELKSELKQRGHQFRTTSDTEVLLALYQHDGLDAFAKINGMLACALWDERARRLVLARDRFGKKPLYYYQDERRFVFASELKAILANGEIERHVNVEALHEYLTHGYIASAQSILRDVYKLPPAHLLVVENGHVTCRPYWEFRFAPTSSAPSEAEAVEHLGTLLQQAVNRRLMSEVPLGAFLSGGLDSSTVVALMARAAAKPVKTFAIGFDETNYSELDDARVVAQHLGTEHHEMIVKPAALDILPELVWHLDEPFGDSSAVPTYYVCRAARQHVTVALSGDGGDEVFAGYARYRQIDRYRRADWTPNWIRTKLVQPLLGMFPFTWPGWNSLYMVGKGTDGGIPYELGLYPYIQERLYAPEFQQQLQESNPFALTEDILKKAQHLDPVSRYQYLDTRQYLPADILTKVDRMSMATSLEVRAPLLDYTVVEYMATLPVSLKLREGVSKYLLRQFCGSLLPPSVLQKRKQGFAIPADRWFQHELRVAAEEILLDRRTVARGYFRKEALQQLLRHHATGQRDYSAWIWCLIVLEMWFRMFLDKEQSTQIQPSVVMSKPANQGGTLWLQ
ncbi:MAG: asparagine synthase (glutamine-hydrolyzing) [Deltaproteobacteria bacterium]|nr:asparagine synthase (glutamine-hydrolyzing) [Deltaproteobacteria bacterium]